MGHAYGQQHHRPDGYFSGLVSGPVASMIDLAEAKAWLRVTNSAEDALITGLAEAATAMLDADEGILGRALITQRWQLTMPAFPASHFVLPVPVVQQVTSITYYDASNVQQTLSTDAYRLTVNGDYACVDLVEGQTFPETYDRSDAVAVQYDTGYGDTPADVPRPIRTAALLLLAGLFDNRQSVTEEAVTELPFGVRFLTMNYRLARGHI